MNGSKSLLITCAVAALGELITAFDPFLDLVYRSYKGRIVWEPVMIAGLFNVSSLGETVFWNRSVEKTFLTTCY